MSDFDLIAITQVLAMKAVLTPDVEYQLRRIQRWYSEKFSTPLKDVENLPIFEVSRHFWEHYYEDMEDEERTRQAQLLAETDSQKEARLKDEEMERISDEAFRQEEIRKQKEELEKNPTSLTESVANQADKVSTALAELAKSFKNLNEDTTSGWTLFPEKSTRPKK